MLCAGSMHGRVDSGMSGAPWEVVKQVCVEALVRPYYRNIKGASGMEESRPVQRRCEANGFGDNSDYDGDGDGDDAAGDCDGAGDCDIDAAGDGDGDRGL